MRRIVRILLLLGGSLALVAAVPVLADFRPANDADRAAWRAELVELERHLSTAYANFQWTVASRSLDLPALHRTADSAIAAASNRRDARHAIRKLIAAFGDGHLHASPPDHPVLRLAERVWRGAGGPIDRSVGPERACRGMGFDTRGSDFTTRFDRRDRYRELARAPFRAGVISFEGSTIGVLRIAHFGEDGYAAACEQAWPAFAAGPGPCDESCQDSLFTAVGDRLLDQLAEALTAMRNAGAAALVVDVTGNGGGTNLADAVARELTATPLRALPVGMIRHPHSAAAIRADDSLLAVDAANPALADSLRRLAQSVRARLARTLAETGTACDLTPLWQESSAGCPLLVRDSIWATGSLAYAAPDALAGMASAGSLFSPSAYRYREGAWRGPLYVLLDRHSASATEQFAALLRDNGAAILLGERTMGAGCGYTRGGVRRELAALGLTVRAPDCARFRASGENERAGIAPDVAVDSDDAEAVLEAVRLSSGL